MLFNEIKNIRMVCNMKIFFVLVLYCIEIWNFCPKHYVSFKIIYTWVYEGALIAGWKWQCFISISKAPGGLITGNMVLGILRTLSSNFLKEARILSPPKLALPCVNLFYLSYQLRVKIAMRPILCKILSHPLASIILFISLWESLGFWCANAPL